MVPRWLRCVVLFLACTRTLLGQTQQAPIRFQTELSQTAIWRGDDFEYRVTLLHHPDVEIVQENLKADSLHVEPFALLALETAARAAAGDMRVLELRLRLVLLEPTGQEAAIPPLTIYYATRKPGPLGKGTQIETHSLVIPGKVVGVGTTLTKDSRDIRDGVTAFPVPRAGRAVWLLGWGMLVAVTLQVALWAFSYYRRKARAHRKRDRRAVERHALQRLDRLDISTDRNPGSEQYGELATTLFDTVTEVTGVEAVNLTPREIKEELLRVNAPGTLAERVRQVLNECEHARYRRPGSIDGNSDFAELVRTSRETVSELARL